jgi:hypothetical protein
LIRQPMTRKSPYGGLARGGTKALAPVGVSNERANGRPEGSRVACAGPYRVQIVREELQGAPGPRDNDRTT